MALTSKRQMSATLISTISTKKGYLLQYRIPPPSKSKRYSVTSSGLKRRKPIFIGESRKTASVS